MLQYSGFFEIADAHQLLRNLALHLGACSIDMEPEAVTDVTRLMTRVAEGIEAALGADGPPNVPCRAYLVMSAFDREFCRAAESHRSYSPVVVLQAPIRRAVV